MNKLIIKTIFSFFLVIFFISTIISEYNDSYLLLKEDTVWYRDFFVFLYETVADFLYTLLISVMVWVNT